MTSKDRAYLRSLANNIEPIFQVGKSGLSDNLIKQVKDALNNGAQAVTVPVEVLKQIFANPNIEKAVNDFNQDWYSMYGDNIGICDIKD